MEWNRGGIEPVSKILGWLRKERNEDATDPKEEEAWETGAENSRELLNELNV